MLTYQQIILNFIVFFKRTIPANKSDISKGMISVLKTKLQQYNTANSGHSQLIVVKIMEIISTYK